MKMGITLFLIICIIFLVSKIAYNKLEKEVLQNLGFSNWDVITYFDDVITVKSRQALEKYDDIKYFKEHKEKIYVWNVS